MSASCIGRLAEELFCSNIDGVMTEASSHGYGKRQAGGMGPAI